MKIYNVLDKILKFFTEECYFRVRWKIYCPGCGGTRAFLALIQGKIIQSIKYNPITLFFILHVLLTTVLRAVDKRNGTYVTLNLRITMNKVFLVFIFLFFVMRNFMLYAMGIDLLGDFS